jgi:hypothetical protein
MKSPQTPHRRGFVAHYGRQPGRLQCLQRVVGDNTDQYSIGTLKSGDQSELADVQSLNDDGEVGHNGHLA